jgi:1,4-dihydroxy-2-naphthoyl-CoA hydrolase
MDLTTLIQDQLKDLFPGLLGIEFLSADTREVKARMTVRPELCTLGGKLHGGALMTLADTLGAVGAFLNLPQGASTTTIESKTNFTGSARQGATVTGTSTLVHKGRSLLVWQTEIRDAEGKLLGLVTQTQMVLATP